MLQLNSGYEKLQGSYLFSEIAKKVRNFQDNHGDRSVIRLGIGDVTKPLSEMVVEAFHQAADEMKQKETFRGYGPEQGYLFLREMIAESDYKSRGVEISPDEIFISTGAKEDTANFQELFEKDIKIAVPDPVYPVYVDSNVMASRSGEFVDGAYQNFVYLKGNLNNEFKPALPETDVDLIYLCFPNNPTGQVLNREELKKWVDYARDHEALILFDAAYVAFIREEGIPHSIYEIEGADEVAVEFRSLSKTAGFTGTRCAYTVIPKKIMVSDSKGDPVSLNQRWFRRQSTKFNGVAYIVQKAASQVFTVEGKEEVRKNTDDYLKNAAIIRNGLDTLNIRYFGGVNSPYVWFVTPEGYDSWKFFDLLLNQAGVVGTPGVGFGKGGEGYFRLSAFGERANVEEAVSRIKKIQL